jgi:hypothetical protein
VNPRLAMLAVAMTVVAGDAAAQGAPPNVNEPARAVLYEEDRADPHGKRFFGSASWRTETVGSDTELAIRSDIYVPQRNLALVILLRHNLEQDAQTSHTIEFRFNNPATGVANVPGMLMKQAQNMRGVPLKGPTVKVADGVFLLGLSEADQDRNVRLLQERAWLDIAIVYNDNRRAILAVAKGPDGIRAFEQAFTSWRR